MNELLQRVIKALYDNDVNVYAIEVEIGFTPDEAVVKVNDMYIRATKDSRGKYTENVHIADIESETSEFVSVIHAINFLIQALKNTVQEGDILISESSKEKYRVIKHHILNTYNLVNLNNNYFQLTNNVELSKLEELISEGKYTKK